MSAGFDPGWLALREPADHRARSAAEPAVLAPLRSWLAGRPAPTRVLDLGSGTGSNLRYLAPRIPGPQAWTLLDHDAALLAAARVATRGVRAADGAAVRVATREGDLAAVDAAALAEVDLVTGSALLDVLTADEVAALADACSGAGVATLLALSVTGSVQITPAGPQDGALAAAFDAHQRRVRDGRRLLGPDAPAVAGHAWAAHGRFVAVAGTPWRLAPGDAALALAWARGWTQAAVEEEPALAGAGHDLVERVAQSAAAGSLRLEVGHADLVALPRRSSS